MAAITAGMVKTLRDRTGQAMMDCKKALTEAEGDIDGAIAILRKKGMAVLEKRAAAKPTKVVWSAKSPPTARPLF